MEGPASFGIADLDSWLHGSGRTIRNDMSRPSFPIALSIIHVTKWRSTQWDLPQSVFFGVSSLCIFGVMATQCMFP